MKSKADKDGEYANFRSALSKVLSISRSEMQERLKADSKKKQRAKKSSSSPASGGKD